VHTDETGVTGTRPGPTERANSPIYSSSTSHAPSPARTLTLDLKDADDMARLRQLLVKADVLIENFRPGTLARLGLTDQDLKDASSMSSTTRSV
jgi:crotonobetainyl-CoA:carnitine CoA-transferase CaiB-like acyl-CoA transferase